MASKGIGSLLVSVESGDYVWQNRAKRSEQNSLKEKVKQDMTLKPKIARKQTEESPKCGKYSRKKKKASNEMLFERRSAKD